MRNNQAGGIVSFAVVAVVLVGLFVGGLLLSKQQGQTARNDSPSPQVSDNTGDQPSANDDATSGDTETAAPTQTPQTSPASPAPAQQAPATSSVATTGPSNDIPSTGPGEVVVGILVLSTLTLAGYRFVLARQAKIDAALDR